jgi:hypothetical protein
MSRHEKRHELDGRLADLQRRALELREPLWELEFTR